LTLTPLASLALAVAALSSAPALADPQGMRVARDAQTGQVRAPTAEENKALDEAAARMRAAKGQGRVGMATGKVDPQAVTHPDGTVELELDESTLVYSVARRKADGSIEMFCVEGSEAASKALSAPKFASRPPSKVAKEQLK
jgi:hypothetical protein